MKHVYEKSVLSLILLAGLLFSSCNVVVYDNWNNGRTGDPVFSRASGTFSAAFELTLSSATPGAGIIYTLDGSIPTRNHGIAYTGPFSISVSTTVKALAWHGDYGNSAVLTAIYTLDPAAVASPDPLASASPAPTAATASPDPQASASPSPEAATASPAASPSTSPDASPSPSPAPAGSVLAGTVKGISADGSATASAPLPGATVKLWNGQTLQATTSTGQDGTFRFEGLAAGSDWKLEMTAASWIPTTVYAISLSGGGETWIQTVSLVSEDFSKGDGSASGVITDAFNGYGLEGVALTLHPGINNPGGPVLATTATGTGGSWNLAGLDSGNYTVLASKDGYISGTFTLTYVCTQDVGNQNATLSSRLSGNGFRVVLTWGETPADLDLHMAVPSAVYPHVYFNRKGTSQTDPWTTLDVDDTSSNGPETISVSQVSSGTYTCYVHDYTNRNQTSSTGLSGSLASVKVYQGDALLYTFNVPAQEGTLWKVFTFDGSVITPVNALMYESSSSTLTSRSLAATPERAWFASLPAKK